jgi:hypothetical protein
MPTSNQCTKIRCISKFNSRKFPTNRGNFFKSSHLVSIIAGAVSGGSEFVVSKRVTSPAQLGTADLTAPLERRRQLRLTRSQSLATWPVRFHRPRRYQALPCRLKLGCGHARPAASTQGSSLPRPILTEARAATIHYFVFSVVTGILDPR